MLRKRWRRRHRCSRHLFGQRGVMF
jgi:hypothetical protein